MDHLTAEQQLCTMQGQSHFCGVCSKLLTAVKIRQLNLGPPKQTFLLCSTLCEQFSVQGIGFLQGFLLSYLVCDILHEFGNKFEAKFINKEFSKERNGCTQLQASSSEYAELAVSGFGLDLDSKFESETSTCCDGLSTSCWKSCTENVGTDVDNTKLSISDPSSDFNMDCTPGAVLPVKSGHLYSCEKSRLHQNAASSSRVGGGCSSVEVKRLRDLESASDHLSNLYQAHNKEAGPGTEILDSLLSPGVKTSTAKPRKRQTQMTRAKRQKIGEGENSHIVRSSSNMFSSPDVEMMGASSKSCKLIGSPKEQELSRKTQMQTKFLSKSIQRQMKEKGVFHCEFCGKEFQVESYLRKHVSRLHSGEGSTECGQCGKLFNNNLTLQSHQYNCHRFSQVCHICGIKFTIKTSFQKHLLAHEGIQRHFCDVCGSGFVHKTSLDKHKFVHVSERSVQCDKCPKMFKAQYLLNQHLLVVHQNGPCFEKRLRVLARMGVGVDSEAVARHANHQCIICGEKLAAGKCPLHPAECQRVFKCAECCLTFDKIISFYRHVKFHRGLNTTTSKVRQSRVIQKRSCVKSVSQKPDGDGGSVFKCPVCSKQFKKKPYLSVHMHQHKAERFSCEICGKRFTYKCNLVAHLPIHSDSRDFRCDICHKTFKHGFALKSHSRLHGESKFMCTLCEKPFTRNLNLQRHYTKMHPDFKPK